MKRSEKYIMKIALHVLGILSCFMFNPIVLAQETGQYQYEQKSPKFKDGIFAYYDMIKNNRPIPFSWIETDSELNDSDYKKIISKSEELVFFDDRGVKRSIKSKEIWGFCHSGVFYVNVGTLFHEVHLVGGVSYFIGSGTSFYPIATTKNKQYLIDFENNSYWPFDLDGMEQLLKDDEQLLNDFKAMKKSKRKSMKYIFLNRYNEKHPFNLPT